MIRRYWKMGWLCLQQRKKTPVIPGMFGFVPGEPRDVLIVVLIQNKFSYVVVNDEAAAKDGVSNLEVMEQNYATGVYEETAFKYAITISSSGTQVAAFDITEIVNDWFKG